MDVIIVDDNDKMTGHEEKLVAHQQGKLHRAFSVFIFNSKNETLLQRRADSKYHSPGLWANACCSHPRLGKELKEEAEKRLQEELGIMAVLTEVFSFTYKAEVGNDLIEHEFDHVFFGRHDGNISPDKKEVSEHRWTSLSDLKKDMSLYPEKYAPWLIICLDKVIEKYKEFYVKKI